MRARAYLKRAPDASAVAVRGSADPRTASWARKAAAGENRGLSGAAGLHDPAAKPRASKGDTRTAGQRVDPGRRGLRARRRAVEVRQRQLVVDIDAGDPDVGRRHRFLAHEDAANQMLLRHAAGGAPRAGRQPGSSSMRWPLSPDRT